MNVINIFLNKILLYIELTTLIYIIIFLFYVFILNQISNYNINLSSFQEIIKKKNKKNNDILLLGAKGSGKTCLFHYLCYNNIPETVTSLVHSTSSFYNKKNNKKLNICDYPGHDRLRNNEIFYNFLSNSKFIVFLIDSCNFRSSIHSSGELLYDILTHPIMTIDPPILFLCFNKIDSPLSQKKSKILLLLQQEVDTLRKTRSSLREDNRNYLALGEKGKAFSIMDDSPCQIELGEISVVDGNIECLLEGFNLIK